MYDKEKDYCTLSPDGLFGVRFNFACYLHDRQYRNEVVNRKTREQADIDFRNWIIKEFKKSKAPFKFDIIGYLKMFLKKDSSAYKFVTIRSKNKYLVWFRNNVLCYPVAYLYYFAVRRFAHNGWK